MVYNYYYLDRDYRTVGPIFEEAIPTHGITGETLMWRQGLEKWTPARYVPEIGIMFEGFASKPYYRENQPLNPYALPLPGQGGRTMPIDNDGPKPRNLRRYLVNVLFWAACVWGAYSVFALAFPTKTYEPYNIGSYHRIVEYWNDPLFGLSHHGHTDYVENWLGFIGLCAVVLLVTGYFKYKYRKQ